MKKFGGFLGKRGSQDTAAPADSPESNAVNSTKLFCESGASSNSGEEVLHLPVIVEACESSPQAAAATARQIRKYLKEGFQKPHTQYNAIMLLRILTDNPGQGFTRNLDEKFRDSMRHLLRSSKDPSVQQIARETLASMERDKSEDQNLASLLQMWKKEQTEESKGTSKRGYPQYPTPQAQAIATYNSRRDSRSPHTSREQRPPRAPNQLPAPHELAGRIEEARTSAKLLIQFTQSTPAHEFSQNELLPEFAERCQAAQRSMQSYMNSDPPPDEDTFQTLIETCEQLSIAQSKHQRAMLAARKEMASQNGATPPPASNVPAQRQSVIAPSQSRASQAVHLPPSQASAPTTTIPKKPAAAAATTIPSIDTTPKLPAIDTAPLVLPTTQTSQPEPVSNPFSDDNASPEAVSPIIDKQPPLVPPPKDPSYNYGKAPHPNPGAVELPADSYNRALPPVPPAPRHANNIHEAPATSAPSKPTVQTNHLTPPSTSHKAAAEDDDEEDLYAVSPVATRTSAPKDAVSPQSAVDPWTAQAMGPSGPMQSNIFPPTTSTPSSSAAAAPAAVAPPPPVPTSSRPAQVQQPTPSYVQRQDSAANGITMHGGSGPASPVDKEKESKWRDRRESLAAYSGAGYGDDDDVEETQSQSQSQTQRVGWRSEGGWKR